MNPPKIGTRLTSHATNQMIRVRDVVVDLDGQPQSVHYGVYGDDHTFEMTWDEFQMRCGCINKQNNMIKKLSDKKRLEIANVCYANVAGSFADFCNQEMRGPNFQWVNFPSMMVRQSPNWMFIHGVRGDRETVVATAAEFTKEIATTLVERSGFAKDAQK